jgi:hypothetical protein
MRTDLLFVMKRSNVDGKLGVSLAKFDMRTALRND